MKNYDHKKIESKIQKEWEDKKIYHAVSNSKKPKFYSLIEFPYPSGDGLHVGHPRSHVGMDIISRKRRMQGFNVLYPIGWDAFGLPTENYAIKTGIHPTIVTKKNIDIFRKQIKMLGISFDWSREINTTDPSYYKWTQWIFLQFFKKGLAYKAKININWCPKDKIGLANEEVIDGKCERCGTVCEKREKEQWMLAITKYADRLDKDLDLVDYPERVKSSQRNWIGKSEGSEIEFDIVIKSAKQLLSHDSHSNLNVVNESNIAYVAESTASHSLKNTTTVNKIKVFTTRADTLFGVTYVVLAPELDLVQKLKQQITNWVEVEKYIENIKKESELDRTAEGKAKTGVELKGIKAINPANNEEVSIWVADYVLANYGTGAVMAVPAHDERDFEFAKKYNLPIVQSIAPYFTKNSEDKDAVRKDKKTVRRKTAFALIFDKKNDRFLCLDWEKYNWHSGIIGGVDEGETYQEAALREIKEETGYVNLKLIKNLGIIQHNHFFAAHKDENRYGIGYGMLFELINEEKVSTKEEDTRNHKVTWIKSSEMSKWLNLQAFQYMWEVYISGSDCFTGYGVLVNSGKFDDLTSEEACKKITEFVGGKMVTKFKLRDWVFSRQRYWGEPIPVVDCEKCGLVAVPDKELPLRLPQVKNYKPTDNGESPLANISKWVNTKCPKCKGKAKRETDTMPNWAGSSWYYLRYIDVKNKKEFASKKNLKYWLGGKSQGGGVDWYNGGMEHTTLHLLYSRFWHKFLFDLKLVPTTEPYKKRTSHGMILGAGGVKMSKSLGNVVNPNEIVKTYGADTLRVYEMFMGPFEEAAVWNTDSIIGARRFIEKVWRIGQKVKSDSESSFAGSLSGRARPALTLGSSACERPCQGNSVSLSKLLNKTIKKVEEDIEIMRFNTAISAMMILTTEMEKSDYVDVKDYKKFLKILAPFAPHVSEEIWKLLGEKKSITISEWPKWDKNLIKDDEVKIAVQVNGKVRAEIMIKSEDNEEEIKRMALLDEAVSKFTLDKEIKKIIYVKNRLVNIVV